jgi:predicted house-cleaning NTP pyrophosphatase (Maf/HAM1 superfamily)
VNPEEVGMKIDRKRVKAAATVAGAAASTAGKKVADRLVLKADEVLAKVGDAAHKRQRRRTAKSALKTAGKLALVTGAGVATVYAGRAVIRRKNGKKSR